MTSHSPPTLTDLLYLSLKLEQAREITPASYSYDGVSFANHTKLASNPDDPGLDPPRYPDNSQEITIADAAPAIVYVNRAPGPLPDATTVTAAEVIPPEPEPLPDPVTTPASEVIPNA